jgi:hypothetical protein
LFYGTTALLTPSFVARRLGVDPDANPAPIHPLRMFGIRTILIGSELLFEGPRTRARSMRAAPLIHASDTASALVGGLRRQLPPRVAVFATLVSGLNTAVAVVGQPRHERRRSGRWLKRLAAR